MRIIGKFSVATITVILFISAGIELHNYLHRAYFINESHRVVLEDQLSPTNDFSISRNFRVDVSAEYQIEIEPQIANQSISISNEQIERLIFKFTIKNDAGMVTNSIGAEYKNNIRQPIYKFSALSGVNYYLNLRLIHSNKIFNAMSYTVKISISPRGLENLYTTTAVSVYIAIALAWIGLLCLLMLIFNLVRRK